MFCEKCGNPLNDNDKFCMKCGCPVENSNVIQQDNSSEVDTAQQPSQETVPPVQQTVQIAQGVAQPEQGVEQTIQTVQPQPKEKKTFPVKLVAIIGGAVLVVAAIVVTLIVVLNQPKSIKITEDYIKVEFEDDLLYNGYAKAQFSIDYQKIDDELLPEQKSGNSSKNIDSLDDWVDALRNYSDYASTSQISFQPLIYFCDIDAYIKGSEESRKEAEDFGLSYYQSVSNISKDDVIIVKLNWTKDPDDLLAMEKMEKVLDISLDKSDVELEIKISDVLSEQSITLEDCVTLDPVNYITENDLIKTDGIVDGGLCVKILPFEYEQDGYTVKSDGSSNYGYYSSYCKVSVYDGDSELYTFMVNLSESEQLSDGDVVTVSFDGAENLGNGILINENYSSYTVAANEALTADTVKSSIDKIKEDALEIAEEEISELSNISIENVYFVETKDYDNYSYQNAIIFILKGKYASFSGTSTKYVELRLFNTYFDGDDLDCTDESAGVGYSKKEDIQKYSSYLNDEDYKVTKIQ